MALLAALAAVVAQALPADASSGSRFPILVMGDSYSAGNGAGEYTGAKGCWRSPNNYAHLYAQALEGAPYNQPTTYENVACSGDSTGAFFSRTHGRPPQLDAVSHEYGLILLTVGGDDEGIFGGIVKNCLISAFVEPVRCRGFLGKAERLLKDGIVQSRLERVLSGIRHSASSKAVIALLGYPYLESDTHYELDSGTRQPVEVGKRLRAIENRADAIQRAVITGLDARDRAHSFVFIDTEQLFKGHELSATDSNPNRWFVEPLTDATVASVSTWYHPNPQGWAEEARLLLRSASIPKRNPLGAKQPTTQPGPVSTKPLWVSLPGTVIAHNEDALLMEDGFVHGPFGGTVFHLIGTRSGDPITINVGTGIPPGDSVEGGTGFLTEPGPGHPNGLAILTARVTTPASGLNPATTSEYFSVFDAATGVHVLLSAPFPVGAAEGPAVAYVGGAVRFAGCEYTTVTDSGVVSHVPFPPGGSEPGSAACKASAVVNNEILIYSPEEACESVYVSNVITQATVSRSPCLTSTAGRIPGEWFFNGAAYGVPDATTFFSAATGAALEPLSEFPFEAQRTYALGGIRSDVALLYSAAGGPSYFVSTSTWQPVFTASSEQRFTPVAIADDDAWVEAAVGHIIIDARTGATVANDWRIVPEAGGPGWTLAVEPQVCCSSEYLLRSNGTLLASLNEAP